MRGLRLISALGILLAVGLAPSQAAAQRVIPGDRPADERLPPPGFAPAPEVEGPILPPYPLPEGPDTGALQAGARVRVREIEITGNSALPSELLRRIAAPYVGTTLGIDGLLELRDRLTLAYVDRGYVTSGAFLPSQSIADGRVRIRIVEGRVRALEIENDGRFRERYLRERLEDLGPGPVNVHALERRLQLLQQDRRIERVEARLVPSTTRGLATLHVRVVEAEPLLLGVDLSNHRNPSIGSYGGELHARYDNALGVGDGVFVRGEFTEGLRQLEARLAVPLSLYDTLLTLRGQWSEADVVSAPVAESFDIESRSWSIGAELRQPLYRSPWTTLETFLRAELRRSQSFLDGSGFSFSIEPDEQGRSKVSVLRFGVEWTRRSRSQVLALRSILSGGLDVFDATNSSRNGPPMQGRTFADGRFVAWLAQAQWALRLPWWQLELLGRADLQLAADPLLPLEQFAMGGHDTLRGYRENTLVRDNGVVASLELRVPVFRRVEPRVQLDLVPFVDLGHSWNTDRETVGQQTLGSAGIGTRLQLGARLQAELFWGQRLDDLSRVGHHDLQDHGIHFRVSARWP